MIEPKNIEINGKTFIISKIPAVAGMEITVKMIKCVQEKIEYQVFEEVLFKAMRFVGVVVDGHSNPIMLTTEALIDNHVSGWEILLKILVELFEHNCSFFPKGRISTLLNDIALKFNQ